MSAPHEENPYAPPAALPMAEGGIPRPAVQGDQLTDTRLMGKFAMSFISLQAVGQVIGSLYLFKLQSMGEEVVEANLRGFMLAWIVPLLLLIPAGALYVVWLYQTATNAQRIKGRPLETPPALGVASYFIPFYFLFGPCASMREIAKVTYRDFPRLRPDGWITAWWLTLLLSVIMQRLAPMLHSGMATKVVAVVLWDVAAVFICMIIRRLSDTQAEIVLPVFTPPPAGTKPAGPRFASPPPSVR